MGSRRSLARITTEASIISGELVSGDARGYSKDPALS
jgi:hypothetical protein